MTPKPPHPPDHLSSEAKAWFKSVAEEFLFTSEAEWSLLKQAAGCLDRLEECRKQLAESGLTVATGTGGEKPHPLVRTEIDNKTLFTRILRELRILTPSNDSRPPR